MMAKNKKISYSHAWTALAFARIMLGFVFLWAFLDKTIGLGFATMSEKSWLAGGSPTTGFLTGAGKGDGPFAAFFGSLAGNPLVDWLFMLGLLGIGLALLLGVGVRIAAVAGTALLVMMWLAVLPLKNNPLIDSHLIYATLLWIVAFGKRHWSFADQWISQDYVQKRPWLW